MTHRWLHSPLSIVAGVLVLTASAAGADDPAVTREADCCWTYQAPVIDGKLDDRAWNSASVIDKFPAFWKQAETAPAHAMKARLLWDREALYFSGEMTDADVRAFGTKHNDYLWNGDVFEMFFKPSLDRPEYFEFQVNPKSVLFEAAFLERNKPVEPFETSKPLGMSAVAMKVDQGWTVEGKIPWSAFGPKFTRPETGATWSFALCRYDYFGPEKTPPVLMSSAPLTRPSFHRFEDYGKLRFVGAPEPLISLLLSKVTAERWEHGDILVTCEATIDNATGRDLIVRSNFNSVFDGLEVVVTNPEAKVLSQTGYVDHQAVARFTGKDFPLKQGKTVEKLTFPIYRLPRDTRSLRVRLVGTLPGSSYQRILSSETIAVEVVKEAGN